MAKKVSKIKFVSGADQFCGAGGFSQGLRWAIEDIEREQCEKIELKLVAINHWDVAIATHKQNHPDVDHICDELEKADPRTLFPDGRLRILISSPECTHFSRALGGKPRNWQSRATAKYVVKWASQLDIADIVIENVADFRTWGPLYRQHADPKMIGRPIPGRKGQYFTAFIRKLEAMGYRVEHRLLVCADYGDATSRMRLFIRARKSGRPINWPDVSHAPVKRIKQLAGALGRPLRPYHVAREIIDWGDLGESVFNRDRPLAPNTMRRIFAGLSKFSGLSFVLPPEGYYRGNQPRSVDEPIQTITAGRGGGHLVNPFLVPLHKERAGQAPRTHSVDVPIPTITTQRNPLLIQPYLVEFHAGKHGDQRTKSVEAPLPTQDTSNRFGVAQPFLVKLYGTSSAAPADAPLPTVTAEGQHLGVAQPFLFQMDHGGRINLQDMGEPLRTITSADSWGMAVPFVMSAGGPKVEPRQLDEPLNTVLTRDHMGVVTPFVLSIRGGEDGYTRGRSIDDPVQAITAHNPMALVQAEGFVVPVNHGAGDLRTHSLDEPMRTVTSVDAWGVATPFLIKYYGTGDGQSVEDPLATVTGRDRFALCIPVANGYAILDIYFRMLRPHELARAHSLGHYTFTGSRENIVKQIGNSVPSKTAKALCYSALRH